MRITFVYRYFWPDTAPLALLLSEMIPTLVEAGHDVSVIAGYPAYGPGAKDMNPPKRETMFGAQIKRMWLPPLPLRGPVMMLFCLGAFFKIVFGPKRDVYWAGSTPPVFQAYLVGLAAKLRGAKMIYQIQDIHPEIGLHSGQMKPGFATRLLAWIDNKALRRADRVTVLSADMAATVKVRSGVEPTILNNFALGVSQPAPRNRAGPVKFAFAGNIGTFQNLGALVEAFEHVPADLAELHFVGDGKAKPGLIEQAQGRANVHFHDRMSAEDAFLFLSQQDIGVVSLDPGLYRLAYPTKLHSYFAANLRVFALVEEDSRLAALIREHDAGDAVGWDKSASVVTERLIALAEAVQSGSATGSVPRALWHKDEAMKRWLKLLEGLAP